MSITDHRPSADGPASSVVVAGRRCNHGEAPAVTAPDLHNHRMAEPDPAITVVPANEASWADLQAVFGGHGAAGRCQCQRYKLRPREAFASFPVEERADRLRQQTDCGHPESGTTSGLVAYLDGEPVGWCAVQPRTDFTGLLRNNRVPWADRTEVKTE